MDQINVPIITKPTVGGDIQTWGLKININYENQEQFYLDVETAINYILENMGITRAELQDLLDEGELLVTELSGKIVDGSVLLSQLNNAITIGSTLDATLNNTITTANTANGNLNTAITNANNANTTLNDTITTAGTTKTALDLSISNANTAKTNLDNAISNATTSQSNLETATTNANTANSTLTTTTGTANTTNTTLLSTTSTANTAKVSLDASISTATTLQGTLDASIVTGTQLKNDIDAQIAGGDLLVKGLGFDNGTYPDIKAITDVIENISTPNNVVTSHNLASNMIADLTLAVNQLVRIGSFTYKISINVGGIPLDNGLFADALGSLYFGTIAELETTDYLVVGDEIEVSGYYARGDGAGHKRIIATTNDGSGVAVGSLFANLNNNNNLNPKWIGAKSDGTVDCAPYFTQALLYNKTITLDSSDIFLFETEVYFPEQNLYGNRVFTINGNGCYMIANNDSGHIFGIEQDTPNYTGKIFITEINFYTTLGDPLNSKIFDGITLYNVFVTCCSFSGIGTVLEALTEYLQSFTMNDNIFTTVHNIIDAKRGYNINFKDNMCEACTNGITINGTGNPAINVIRIEGNLFEGGGKFLELAQCLGGSIEGNYLESNATTDSEIDLDPSGTVAGSSQWNISDNQIIVTDGLRVQDPDYTIIKLPKIGGTLSANNWGSCKLYNIVPLSSIKDVVQTYGDNDSVISKSLSGHTVSDKFSSSRNIISKQLVDINNSGTIKIARFDIASTSQKFLETEVGVSINIAFNTIGGIVGGAVVVKFNLGIFNVGSGTTEARESKILGIDIDIDNYNFIQCSPILIDTILNLYSVEFFTTKPALSYIRTGNVVEVFIDGFSNFTLPNYGSITYVDIKQTFLNTRGVINSIDNILVNSL